MWVSLSIRILFASIINSPVSLSFLRILYDTLDLGSRHLVIHNIVLKYPRYFLGLSHSVGLAALKDILYVH